MSFVFNHRLRCPLDGLPLLQDGGTLRCDNRHVYDIARQGYVNLLGAGDKRSFDPGDSQVMVQARRAFLDGGFYQPLLDKVHSYLDASLADGATVLDAGCGEGYYLHGLHALASREGRQAPNIIGVDISKWAVRAAAKRGVATWLVASNRRIPLADNSIDVLLDMFGFPHFEEFARVLRPGGLLLRATAGHDHLRELREHIYANPRLENTDETGRSATITTTTTSGQFICSTQYALRYTIEALAHPALAALFQMTPHYFRAPPESKERLAAVETLDLSVHINIDIFSRLGER